MVRVRQDLQCPLCGSVLFKIIVDDRFHKVLTRKCKLNCINTGKIVEDYGYSEKAKIKLANKKKNVE